MGLEGFHEVRFPLRVAFGATGGPERRTEVITLASGYEERNARWAASRRRYDAGDGVRSLDDLYEVIAFFEERRGRLYGFRYVDPLDHASCRPGGTPAADDQVIGTGDGSRAVFQLIKTYGALHAPYERAITKPVVESLVVAVDGRLQAAESDYVVSAATGELTFLPGAVPVSGALVTAGFLFDTPVRFDTDRLEINLRSFEAGVIPSIPILEIRQ